MAVDPSRARRRRRTRLARKRAPFVSIPHSLKCGVDTFGGVGVGHVTVPVHTSLVQTVLEELRWRGVRYLRQYAGGLRQYCAASQSHSFITSEVRGNKQTHKRPQTPTAHSQIHKHSQTESIIMKTRTRTHAFLGVAYIEKYVVYVTRAV